MQNSGGQAVFLIDYTSGTFYASDPADVRPERLSVTRQTLATTTMDGESDEAVLSDVQYVWSVPCGDAGCPLH